MCSLCDRLHSADAVSVSQVLLEHGDEDEAGVEQERWESDEPPLLLHVHGCLEETRGRPGAPDNGDEAERGACRRMRVGCRRVTTGKRQDRDELAELMRQRRCALNELAVQLLVA